ncbi:MAG: hypothetical protein ABFS37_03410 [Acidobacteriota bacterium]
MTATEANEGKVRGKIPVDLWIVAIFLVVYAWKQTKIGVLR